MFSSESASKSHSPAISSSLRQKGYRLLSKAMQTLSSQLLTTPVLPSTTQDGDLALALQLQEIEQLEQNAGKRSEWEVTSSEVKFQQDLQRASRNSLKEEKTSLSARRLEAAAARFGYTCREMPRDGNCFFHGVENQLKYHDDFKQYSHIALRALANSHIKENRKWYEQSLMDYKAFLKGSGPGKDADSPQIVALSRALKITIVLVQNHNPENPVIIKQTEAKATVYLGYQYGIHYQSLVPDSKPLSQTKRVELQKKIEATEPDNAMALRKALSEKSPALSFSEAERAYYIGESAHQADEDYLKGIRYRRGYGVAIDFKKAWEHLMKAVSQGHSRAQYYCGMMARYGEGEPKDPEKAQTYFKACLHALQRQAESKRDAWAVYSVAEMYQEGYGVEKNIEAAKRGYRIAIPLLRSAAEQGVLQAQYCLAGCYVDDLKLERDQQAMFTWWRQAAEQGYAPAQYNVGVCYDNGQGIEKDKGVAVSWYRQAAEQGYGPAQLSLGVCYSHGQGVEKDDKVAVNWYRNAADQGDVQAQFNLGACYADGEGVEKDEKAAFSWYRKAGEQGHVIAQYNRVLPAELRALI
jgi:TPR repeat protein